MEAHGGQERKGGVSVPYVVHPVHVAFMLARLGLDEETIVAAILHDVVEDCDSWTTARVELEFGAEVAGVVAQLTEDKSLSWTDRKQAAVDHVQHMCERAVRVKAADKLHNLESLVAELDRCDDHATIWLGFKGGREGTLRVARGMVEALVPRLDPRFADALSDVLARLETHAGA